MRALDLLERAYDLGVGLATVSLSTYYMRRCKYPHNYPRAINWSKRALATVFLLKLQKLLLMLSSKRLVQKILTLSQDKQRQNHKFGPSWTEAE